MEKINSRVIDNNSVSMRLDIIDILVDAFKDFVDTGTNNYRFILDKEYTLNFTSVVNEYNPDYPYYVLTITDNTGHSFNLDFDYDDIEAILNNVLDGIGQQEKLV